MIYQKIEFTVTAEWLDPEGVNKFTRSVLVEHRLLKLFRKEFAKRAGDCGVKLEVTAVDGVPLLPDQKVKVSIPADHSA